MRVDGAVVLVTGANRGLGLAFTEGFIAAGASKVYGSVRDRATTLARGVEPVVFDIADPASVQLAARAMTDVSIVVSNAGINTWAPILGDPADVRREMETNFFGTLTVAREFAPALAVNGGGYLINVLSTLSWVTGPQYAAYAAAKAASWSATNALRLELLGQGTRVMGVHCGPVDTDMGAGMQSKKLSPSDVVAQTIAGIESEANEVLTDPLTTRVRAKLSEPLSALYPQLDAR